MKKISIILAACVAALGFFSSCSDDVEEPSVNLLNTNGVITAGVAEEVTFGYKVEKGTENIASLTVVLSQEGVELTQELVKIDATTTTSPKLSDLNKAGGYTFEFVRTFQNEGKYEVLITAIDKDGEKGYKKATITIGDGVDKWASAVSEIKADGTYAYKQGNKEGKIVVSNLTEASVTVKLDNNAEVVLSDAGDSWLKKDGTTRGGVGESNGTTAEEYATLLCAKKNKAAAIVSGELTSVGAAEGLVFVEFLGE